MFDLSALGLVRRSPNIPDLRYRPDYSERRGRWMPDPNDPAPSDFYRSDGLGTDPSDNVLGTYAVPQEWPPEVEERNWPPEVEERNWPVYQEPEWMKGEAEALRREEERKREFGKQMFESLRQRKTPSAFFGLSQTPGKSSKFPLPPVSASQAHAFQLFVQKAKPLKRAMATLKEAMTALRAGDARGAVYLSIRAAVLAGRGSAAVPKLAARITEAAAGIAKRAMEIEKPAVADLFGLGDPKTFEDFLKTLRSERTKLEFEKRTEGPSQLNITARYAISRALNTPDSIMWKYLTNAEREAILEQATKFAREADEVRMTAWSKMDAPERIHHYESMAKDRIFEGDFKAAINFLKEAHSLAPGWKIHDIFGSVGPKKAEIQKTIDVVREMMASRGMADLFGFGI